MAPKTLKQLARRAPYLGGVLSERDGLRRELAEARAAADSAEASRSSLEEEGVRLAREREVLVRERDAARAAADALARERDTANAAVAALSSALGALEAELASAREEGRALSALSSALGAEAESLRARLADAEAEVERLRTWVPPGHFYSPFPEVEEVLRKEHEIWRKPLPRREIPGVEMHEAEQLRLLDEFTGYYREQPFHAARQPGLRYHFENENYSYSDAIFHYCMLRHLRPRRFIEVGSGFSSAVTLDTDELFLGNSLACTFIDPHPELLLSLIKEEDKPRIEIVGRKVQDVDPRLFDGLGDGDVLFVDSTHVAKTLSDVNHLFFEVLPRLRAGVAVHLHDVFYPFVYPKDWELERRAWNEAYLLRAFLQYNDTFRVYFCNTFLEYFHDARFKRELPLCMKNTGGSIWLRKVR